MIIYRCIVCNDEMFSDAFKVIDKGFTYEVEGKRVTRSDGIDDALIGANASAEEVTETTDPTTVSGVDIVLNHKLQETGFTKKQYMTYLKEYMKAVKANLEENCPAKVDEFITEAPKAVKKLMEAFGEYQFFTGESMNPNGMVGLLNYREDGNTPYMIFLKDGLIVEKF